jgi:hypothetical protein
MQITWQNCNVEMRVALTWQFLAGKDSVGVKNPNADRRSEIIQTNKTEMH